MIVEFDKSFEKSLEKNKEQVDLYKDWTNPVTYVKHRLI